MKKAITVGVYNPRHIHQASPYCGDNVFAKGLEYNGYNVVRLDYRNESDPNGRLLKISSEINPDLFWFGKCERIAPETIERLRSMFSRAIFIKWAADVRNEPTIHDLAHNQYIDYFFGTFGGDYLKKHLLSTMKGVGSIIGFVDSSFFKPIKVSAQWCTDILWTGTYSTGDNPMRDYIIKELLDSKLNTRLFGVNEPWLGNPEYLYAINGAKISIGANSYNRTKYSSGRMSQHMSCGTFYLAHYFEGIEEIFERGKHLDWFYDTDEMMAKIKYYLKNDIIREKIAKNGREFVVKHFDCKPLVKNILDIVKNRKSNNKWDDLYLN